MSQQQVKQSIGIENKMLDEYWAAHLDDWSFEGVDYLLDASDNFVYDEELSEHGYWDTESDKIVWNSTSSATLHTLRYYMKLWMIN
jgi:hypothetical protein